MEPKKNLKNPEVQHQIAREYYALQTLNPTMKKNEVLERLGYSPNSVTKPFEREQTVAMAIERENVLDKVRTTAYDTLDAVQEMVQNKKLLPKELIKLTEILIASINREATNDRESRKNEQMGLLETIKVSQQYNQRRKGDIKNNMKNEKSLKENREKNGKEDEENEENEFWD